MGTRVTIDVRDEEFDPAAVEGAFDWLRWVDRTFTTFDEGSEIARLNRGELTEAGVSPEVREVLAACRAWRERTDGAFDAEAAALMPQVRDRPGGGNGRPGAVEPAGYVKGWALDRAWEHLAIAGVSNAYLEAGGDILTRGHPGPNRSWRLGIQHPGDPAQVAAVLEAGNLALATSGEYRRGAHIVDARGGRPNGARSVSCVARDLATADVLATAGFAMGETGLDWLAAQDGVEAMVIGADDVVRWTPGFGSLLASPA